MKPNLLILAGIAAGMAAAEPALARDSYDEAFFVRTHATAQDLFHDRTGCRQETLHMGDTAAAYSDPEYGALSAMGSALDEDALHEGGLHKRMQQAVFTNCMKRQGWTPADPGADETKLLVKAANRHPETVDAWLKAHEPPPAPPSPSQPDPAPQTLKTAAGGAPPASSPRR